MSPTKLGLAGVLLASMWEPPVPADGKRIHPEAVMGTHWGDAMPAVERALATRGRQLARGATELRYAIDLWGFKGCRTWVSFEDGGLDTFWFQFPVASDAELPAAYARMEALVEGKLQAPGSWKYYDRDTMASVDVRRWQDHAAQVVKDIGYFGTDWFLAREIATLTAGHEADPPEHGALAGAHLTLVVSSFRPEEPAGERTIADPFTAQ